MLQVNPAELMTKVTEAKKEYVSIVRQAEAIKEAEKVSLHNYTFFFLYTSTGKDSRRGSHDARRLLEVLVFLCGVR